MDTTKVAITLNFEIEGLADQALVDHLAQQFELYYMEMCAKGRCAPPDPDIRDCYNKTVVDLLDIEAHIKPPEQSAWEDDGIQFPRLLSEISAVADLSTEQIAAIAESMDLEPAELHTLFARAEQAWELILHPRCRYISPDGKHKKYSGQICTILSVITKNSKPMLMVRFDDGMQTYAYPDEFPKSAWPWLLRQHFGDK